MGNICKAVIPAAGTGSRMAPLTDYMPKGMLPLGKKPVLHHIINELREAAIEEIAIVSQSNQTAIFSYFRDFPEVEFIIDDSKSGPGGALLKARSFVDEENFISVFVDAPIMGAGRGAYLKTLADLRTKTDAAAALALYKVSEAEMGSRGIVTFKSDSEIESEAKELADITEKPVAQEAESRWASACRYVLTPKIFKALEQIRSDENDELQLTNAVRYLLQNGEVVIGSVLAEGLKRYDTGNFEDYFDAFEAFAQEAEI